MTTAMADAVVKASGSEAEKSFTGEESDNGKDEEKVENTLSGDGTVEQPSSPGTQRAVEVALSSQWQRSPQESENDTKEVVVEPSNMTVITDASSSGNRLTDGQKKQSTTGAAVSPASVQGSTESSSVQHEILEAMRSTAEALGILQESAKEGVQEFRNFAATISDEAKRTNSLLGKLVEEMSKLSLKSSHSYIDRSTVNDDTAVMTVNVSNKETDWAVPHDGNDQGDILLKLKGKENLIDRMENHCILCPKDDHVLTDLHPDVDKCITNDLYQWINNPGNRPELPENASQQQKRSQSNKEKENKRSEPAHRQQARDTMADNSTLSSLTSPSSSQAFPPLSATNEKARSGTAEDNGPQSLPLNISESRVPVTGIRDVRPKELTSNSRERSSRHRRGISADTFTIQCHGHSEHQRLRDALARARAPDPNPPPKARSYDTILCLDISESMTQNDAYHQMIDIVNKFVNGIEDMTGEVEENIGVVAFGGRANIVQHLTIDFSLIRDAIGKLECSGSSPFFEAVVTCLGALDGRSGTVSLSKEYEIHPRLIFITDGHITEGTDDPIDRVVDATNTRASFSRLMMDLNPNKDPSMPRPIIFVPVGSRADRLFLKSMAELSDGLLIEPENLMSVCNYFKIQETIGKVIVVMHSRGTQDTSEHDIKAIALALVPSIDKQELAEVKAGVRQELDKPSKRKVRSNPLAFDSVFEDKDGVMSNERLPLGTRVVRGPDWIWGDQDQKGTGTVIQHEDERHGFTWVLWDEGHWNRYPYGSEMGYHIWKTEEHPVLRSSGGSLQIGMEVKKGPKWCDPELEYDREPGTVIRVSRLDGKLKIRWKNGIISACPASDVEFSDPFEQGKEREAKEVLQEANSEEEEEDGNKIPVWQWRDDWGNWRLYTRQERERLEAAYKRKRNGTCVLIRGKKQVRILFQRKTEKDVEKHTERDIQRIFLSKDDLQSLEVAEELVSND